MKRPFGVEQINLSWLIKLRWWAIAGQVVTILGVDRLMGIPLPLAPLFAIIAVELATNLLCARRQGRAGRFEARWVALVMVLDVLLLTGLLYFTGGPFNPFSFLYLVEIALAAVVLPPRWTWMLVGLSLACSGVLFLDHRELAITASTHVEHMGIHLRGMWVAFVVAAGFIVYFLMRVTRALAERDAELAAARHLAARQEKLASLATLAAGAAHELSTPLSTIALAAKELERNGAAGDAAVEDVKLIRAEVARCRRILERMATDAGESAGEEIVPVSVAEVVAASLAELEERPPVRVELDPALGARRLSLPPRAIAQALRGLLKNAQDATSGDEAVALFAVAEADALRIEVRDRGSGMPPDVLARAGEPFFTTKSPGRGMGLGLFLTRAIVERLGGQLRLESEPGRGTTALLTLPFGDRATTKIERVAERS